MFGSNSILHFESYCANQPERPLAVSIDIYGWGHTKVQAYLLNL